MFGLATQNSKRAMTNLQLTVLDTVRMVLGTARVAVVFVWGHFSVAESNTGAVLPHLACLALNHHALMVYYNERRR